MSNNDDQEKLWHTDTQAIRGAMARTEFNETSEALFLTSGYVYETAEEAEDSFNGNLERYVYSRVANPTVRMFEKRLALIEGAEDCRATATGMAAVFAALVSYLNPGDRLVVSQSLFGSCHYICDQLLPRLGITTELIDGTSESEWKRALEKETHAVFLETPSNPTLEIIDLKMVSQLAHSAGAMVFVDNVFATPLLQSPIRMGADVVIYSATKHIDGQGRCLGGAVLGNTEYIEEKLTPFIKHTGPSLSPFNAWVLLKGLETLSLRLTKQCSNALQIAEFLSEDPKIAKIIYPELTSHPQHSLAMRQMKKGGTIVSFELCGGKEQAYKFMNKLQLIDISNNLGDTKTLVCHPSTTTHQRLSIREQLTVGIHGNLIRLSVGLESLEDLRSDLKNALSV
jgi:O-succinylhomoserine sulfhydrylase